MALYKKSFPYKNYKGQPRTREVYFNLEVREVMLLLEEFYIAFQWQENAQEDEVREYTPAETVAFYTAFENILLAAYGVVSDDGERFEKDGVFAFKESKLFAAAMEHYIKDPAETNTLVNTILPEGLEELIKASEGNMQQMVDNPDTPEAVRRQIQALQAKLPAEQRDALTS